jgi:hypothetical protein
VASGGASRRVTGEAGAMGRSAGFSPLLGHGRAGWAWVTPAGVRSGHWVQPVLNGLTGSMGDGGVAITTRPAGARGSGDGAVALSTRPGAASGNPETGEAWVGGDSGVAAGTAVAQGARVAGGADCLAGAGLNVERLSPSLRFVCAKATAPHAARINHPSSTRLSFGYPGVDMVLLPSSKVSLTDMPSARGRCSLSL